MKRRLETKLIGTLALLGIASSLAAAQVTSGASFMAPMDAVWQATIETTADSHFEVQSSDKASGVIWLKEAKTVNVNSFTNNLIKRYTTKKVSGFSNWQGISISGSLTVKEQDTSTDVVCHFSYSGYNKWGGWERLESNGYLENAMLTGISNRLKTAAMPGIGQHDGGAAQHVQSATDQVIKLANITIEKLRKVDAAFKIDAVPETITSNMIDAQAQFDEFASTKFSIDVSKLRDSLAEAVEGFKKARNVTGQDRSDELVRSRSALANAVEAVQALKSVGK